MTDFDFAFVSFHKWVRFDRPGECSPDKDYFVITLNDVSTT